MKYKMGDCHAFCLFIALIRLLAVSVAGPISKFVCPGASVQVIGNITFNNCNSFVSLYINGKRNTLIATWLFANCSRNETILPDYNDRVFLYSNGTILIHNIHPWDQAKYTVYYQMGDKPMQDVVEIKVMASPANDCKPSILDLKNSLFASLKSNYCGKPVATLYWKEYGDVPKTIGPVLKLNPGNQNGIYNACIEGPALTCVRNALDYCSSITIERYESPPPIVKETFDIKIVISVVVGIILVIILTTVAMLIRKHCMKTSRTFKEAVKYRQAKCNSGETSCEKEGRTEEREVNNWNTEQDSSRITIVPEDESDDFLAGNVKPLLQRDQHRPTYFDAFNGQHCVPLEKQHDIWKKQFNNLTWEEIKQLLNDEQKQGLKNACDTFDGQHIVPLEKHREIWTKHFDGLKWEEIKQFFNDEQKQGFKNDCDSLNMEDIKRLLHVKQQEGLDDGCDNLSGEQTYPLEKIKELWNKQLSSSSGQHTDLLEKIQEQWNKILYSLNKEDIKRLLHVKQQEGLDDGGDNLSGEHTDSLEENQELWNKTLYSEDKSKEATCEPSTP